MALAMATLMVLALALTGWQTVGVLAFFLALSLVLMAWWLAHRSRLEAPAHLFMLAMVAVALGIGMGVDIVTIGNDIDRMNTVFKLYLNAWVLFGIVAAVACEDEVTAREAAALVRVTYTLLDPVLRPKDALTETDFPLHEGTVEGTNIHKKVDQEFGDPDGAFERASSVAEGTFVFHGINHGFTEPIGCIAVPEADGRMTLVSATQVPHYLHRSLARVLDLPMHRVRIIKPLVWAEDSEGNPTPSLMKWWRPSLPERRVVP